MLMPDPLACLQRVHRVLKTGGRIAVGVWGPADTNPWVSVPMAILVKRLNVPPSPPGTPGIFALADDARLRSLFEAAGFDEVTIEPVAVTMVDLPSGREFVEYAVELSGPLAMLMKQVSPADQETVTREIARAVEGPGGHTTLPGLALVASATK
jgi:hypothetical protein